MNLFNIRNSFITKVEKGWSHLFICVDVHDTIIRSHDWNVHNIHEFHNGAEEVLKFLSSKRELILILNTCSHDDDIKLIIKWLRSHGIIFDFINENPMVCGISTRANFSKKMNCNIIFEDKAGFEAETDWLLIKKELKLIYNIQGDLNG